MVRLRKRRIPSRYSEKAVVDAYEKEDENEDSNAEKALDRVSAELQEYSRRSTELSRREISDIRRQVNNSSRETPGTGSGPRVHIGPIFVGAKVKIESSPPFVRLENVKNGRFDVGITVRF